MENKTVGKSDNVLKYKTLSMMFHKEFGLYLDRKGVPLKKSLDMLERSIYYMRKVAEKVGRKNITIRLVRVIKSDEINGSFIHNEGGFPAMTVSAVPFRSNKDELQFMNTFFHELGHMVDFQFFRVATPSQRIKYNELIEVILRDAYVVPQLNRGIWQQCQSVDEYLNRPEMLKEDYGEYYISKEETFARLFAQHLVSESDLVRNGKVHFGEYRLFSSEQDKRITQLVNHVISVIR